MLLILIGGVLGIRYFNNMWFKEKVDYLKVSTDYEPIKFIWVEGTYGDYVEKNDAIIIYSQLNELKSNLSFQFDTGDPTTRVRRNFLEFIKTKGILITEIVKDEQKYIEKLNLNLGGSRVELEMILIDERYVNPINNKDTMGEIRVGTIGADLLNKYISELDFKKQQIKFYSEREEWMTAVNDFKPFDFSGRRFMLPCEIDHRTTELFYSYCS